MRWNDHLSARLVIQNSLRDRLAIVRAITDEGLKWSDDLREQIRHSRWTVHVRHDELAGDNLIMFVNRKMEFAPGLGSRNVVLLLMPFRRCRRPSVRWNHDDDGSSAGSARAGVLKDCTWKYICSSEC